MPAPPGAPFYNPPTIPRHRPTPLLTDKRGQAQMRKANANANANANAKAKAKP
jgi:hypothetical protein